MSEDRNAMERLRTETWDLHQATERTELGRAMSHARITRRQYAALLAGYQRIHAAIEEAVTASDDPRARTVFVDDMHKTEAIERDLLAIAGTHLPTPPIDDGVAELVAEIARARHDAPRLFGHLYVMEGASLGATMLLPKMLRALALSNESMRYFFGYGPTVLDHWAAFQARVNAALVDEAERDRAVLAARATFAAIGRLFDGIVAATAESDAELHAVA